MDYQILKELMKRVVRVARLLANKKVTAPAMTTI